MWESFGFFFRWKLKKYWIGDNTEKTKSKSDITEVTTYWCIKWKLIKISLNDSMWIENWLVQPFDALSFSRINNLKKQQIWNVFALITIYDYLYTREYKIANTHWL